MKISTKILKTFENGNLKAIASLCFDDSFVIKNIRVIDGNNGLFIAFPSEKSGDNYYNICHPINNEFRLKLQELVISAYAESFENH